MWGKHSLKLNRTSLLACHTFERARSWQKIIVKPLAKALQLLMTQRSGYVVLSTLAFSVPPT